MTPPLATATAPGQLHRIGRGADAWQWPDWAFAGADGTFGNRYDDPRAEYRVIYAASQRLGAFVETLARYRPDPALVAAYAEIEADDEYPTIPPGVVPAEWPANRCAGTATHDGSFADVGQAESIAHLRANLAALVLHHRLDDLDAAALRLRAPRSFTQGVSRYVFERGVAPDGRSLAGIRYLSRLGDDVVNWAIFEGTEVDGAASEPIAADDPDLVAALGLLDLTLGGI